VPGKPAEDSGVEQVIVEREIEGTDICRPHLFFRSDVAGLIEPTTVLADSGPTGRWLLCLQRANGSREVMSLPPWLDLEGGTRLWFSPLPDPPQPGTAPRWSAEGRRRWLDGYTPEMTDVFHNLCNQISQFVVFPDGEAFGQLATLSLWVLLTYCYPAWPAVPYLRIAGTLASGKSRLLDVLARLVWRPTLASSMTAGVLFRTLHDHGGTLLLDEAERLQHQSASSEVNTVLLAGYKAGGRVARLKKEGSGFTSVYFDVFGPKALGGIGDVIPALASRCIRMNLVRTPGDCPQVRARLDADPSRWQELRDDLYAFALSHAAEIVQAARSTDGLTDGMSGRDAELWDPLLALVSLGTSCSENLVEQVRRFADQVIANNQDDTTPEPETTLLAILSERILNRQADVTPKEILDAAQRAEPVTFARWTPHRVASALRRYGLLTSKTTGGRRSYYRTTPEQMRCIARVYGLCIPTGNATFAADATNPQ
jgi:hypothetical protein